jgi:hypothetical protein
MVSSPPTTNIMIKELLTSFLVVCIYGILLTIISNTFFEINYSVQNILGLGLFWYFLKYELPIIFRKYFGGNQ